MKSLCAKIRAARKAAGMTQEEVARHCEMTLTNYARIERGESGTTVATMECIAKALGLQLALVESEQHSQMEDQRP